MHSAFDDPRVRPLLVEADRLLAALSTSDATERADIMDALDAVHRDIGRFLHDAWIERSAASGRRAPAPAPSPDIIEIENWEPLSPASADDAWVAALQDLLALLAEPPVSPDLVRLAAEASSVQWATVRIQDQWAPFPTPIQQALLGLLTARCRHLADELSMDHGPQRALSRLDRHRRATGLSPVLGLDTGDQPESGSWPSDANHWWDMLVSALQPESP